MSTAEASSSPGSPFWRFSLAFYRLPAVADACIALQEQAGVDVNLLLFLLWQATRGRELSQTEVADLQKKGAVKPITFRGGIEGLHRRLSALAALRHGSRKEDRGTSAQS